jgi:hypothetical protein
MAVLGVAGRTPEDDERREARALEEERPAAFGVVFVRDRPAMPLRL